MSDEIRRIIREKVVEKIKAGVSIIDDRYIYKSRILSLPDDAGSAISVYTLNEDSDKSASEDSILRTQEVIVAVWVRGPDAVRASKTSEKAVDDNLDEILGQIEDSLFAQYQTLDKTVHRLNYVGTKIEPADTSGNAIILMANMSFTALYKQDF